MRELTWKQNVKCCTWSTVFIGIGSRKQTHRVQGEANKLCSELWHVSVSLFVFIQLFATAINHHTNTLYMVIHITFTRTYISELLVDFYLILPNGYTWTLTNLDVDHSQTLKAYHSIIHYEPICQKLNCNELFGLAWTMRELVCWS